MSAQERKELLLAAKAAGIKPDTSETNGGGIGNNGFDMNGDMVLDWHNNKKWNPRRYYADAFRLAVQLDLLIMPYPEDKAVRVTQLDQPNTIVYWVDCDDKHQATCLAITRAAAAIGAKMP